MPFINTEITTSREIHDPTPATLMVPDASGGESLGKFISKFEQIERKKLNEIDEKS